MTKIQFKPAALAIAALLALPLAQAATMSKDEYKSAKSRIESDYKTDKKACDAMSGNGKDVCVQEAKGKEKVAKAELEYNYTANAKDEYKLRVAKAEATYDIAKEKCDDLSGNAKDVCVKEAKASETKAKADAKASEKVGDARKDAADDKRTAEYKVAIEKCDALAGDAKSNCVAAAKSSYGKI